MDAMTHMPAAFLGHGSPMNALERNRYTEAWRAIGASLPRPRAILMVSAHWYVPTVAVTAMARPRTIHDFFGFPKPLFDMQYPAPGLPELAEEVADVAKPDHVGADHDGWGLDHGTWSVLVHAFPDADVPVVQLSIDLRKPPEWHLEMGARLAALRERGIMVMGSGNVVHNLRAIDWRREDFGFDWARRFEEHATRVLSERPDTATSLVEHPDYLMAAPTPEHFLPVLYVAGFAAATGQQLDQPVAGYAYGSLSMTSHTAGVPCPETEKGLPGVAPLGTDVRPEESNL